MKERFYRFMQGRYGQDQLSKFLTYAALVCVILNIFVKSSVLYWAFWILIIYAYFRIFSCRVLRFPV